MIRKILAAVDGSPQAKNVVAAATEVGARFGAEVSLLRVVSLPQEYPAAAANGPDALPAEVRHTVESDLEVLAKGAPSLRLEPPLVYAGQPWRAICERAGALDVDLIVVGSHGYRGWDRILGTTAGKVADHADRSVLVVHERRD